MNHGEGLNSTISTSSHKPTEIVLHKLVTAIVEAKEAGISTERIQHELANVMNSEKKGVSSQIVPQVSRPNNQEGGSDVLINLPSTTDLSDFENRQATFGTRPYSYAKLTSLIESGFYFDNDSNEIKCHKCALVFSNWKFEDCPFEKHLELSPKCELRPELERQKKLSQEIAKNDFVV